MLKATTELFSAPKAGPIVRGRIPTPLLEEVLRGPAAGQTDRSPEGVGAGAAEEAGPSDSNGHRLREGCKYRARPAASERWKVLETVTT